MGLVLTAQISIGQDETSTCLLSCDIHVPTCSVIVLFPTTGPATRLTHATFSSEFSLSPIMYGHRSFVTVPLTRSFTHLAWHFHLDCQSLISVAQSLDPIYHLRGKDCCVSIFLCSACGDVHLDVWLSLALHVACHH